jgi:hypothetical protein
LERRPLPLSSPPDTASERIQERAFSVASNLLGRVPRRDLERRFVLTVTVEREKRWFVELKRSKH